MSRILVIDDDPGNRLIMRSRLVAERHEVTLSEGGAHGLVEARNATHELCLVAADMTKGIDGFEVCRRLKAMPETAALPVILFSQSSNAHEATERAYQAGCDGYVTRTELPALDYVVRMLARQRQQALELGEQNRVLTEQVRKLGEGRSLHSEAESHAKDAGDPNGLLRELACSRPDGLVIVDGEGTVRHADRGACEILGTRIVGRHLGSLAPASRLEAFVRDSHTESREGFRFDLAARKGGLTRSFQAALVPLVPVPGEHDPGLRVVLFHDSAKRRVAAELLRVHAPGIACQELGALREAAREVYRPSAWIGSSAGAVDLRRTLAAVSQSRDPVFIVGADGTGKTRLARTLHYSGPSTGQFVHVRCSALTPDNLDLELFGATRDAVPGSTADRPGLFQQAQDGTLYLDGVRELSLDVQAKVLRFLEDGALTRRGARRAERADVRVLASGAAPLTEAVAEGRFSKELYAKLAGTTIAIAPLVERIEDVEGLALHFIQEHGAWSGISGISPAALALLNEHSWPGNVTELESCIEQACLRATGPTLTVEDLPRTLRHKDGASPDRELSPARPPVHAQVDGTHSVADTRREVELPRAEPRVPGDQVRLPADLARTSSEPVRGYGEHARASSEQEWELSFAFYEKQLLMRALEAASGDKIAAAKLLDVGKSTLYRKLKRYGIR